MRNGPALKGFPAQCTCGYAFSDGTIHGCQVERTGQLEREFRMGLTRTSTGRKATPHAYEHLRIRRAGRGLQVELPLDD